MQKLKIKNFGFWSVVLIFGLWISAVANAVTYTQDKEFETKARAIADQLRCPVCRGIPIAESPAELAQNMMQEIRSQLRQGKSEEEILNYFEERYGEWILLQPKPKGMNLSLWFLPAALLTAGVVLLFFAIRRWTHNP